MAPTHAPGLQRSSGHSSYGVSPLPLPNSHDAPMHGLIPNPPGNLLTASGGAPASAALSALLRPRYWLGGTTTGAAAAASALSWMDRTPVSYSAWSNVG